MGMTHGEPQTYPRTADVMGFCKTEHAVAIAEAVVTVQRDWGDRSDRKHARLKYTIEDRGLAAFRAEVERRAGVTLDELRPYAFTSTGDRYGWVEGEDGRHHLTLFIENGRVRDAAGGTTLLTGLREIARTHDGDIRLTANQNLVIANVAKENRAAVERLADLHGLLAPRSGLRRNAMACVALPTCGLALAESERYLPDLVTALDARLAAHDLAADDIVIRMTGCPNGCARPYIAEIGLVGKGPGRYNLYLGAAFDGSRLSKLYAEDLQHDEIVAKLDPCWPPMRKSARPANASAISSSAPVSWPRPPTGAISTPIPAQSALGFFVIASGPPPLASELRRVSSPPKRGARRRSEAISLLLRMSGGGDCFGALRAPRNDGN